MSDKKNEALKEGLEVLKKRGYDSFVPIGSGGQANVYKTMKNKIPFAAKVVHIAAKSDEEEDIKRELAIIRNLKHPNCIRVEDMFRTKHKIYIIMDYMPNQCIADEVDTKGALCEWKSKLYFTQICCALKYLHRNQIAHRDLKLDNILLDSNFNVKVCDFGFSKFVEKDTKTGKTRKSETFVGTASYEPPEMVNNMPYNPYKCDIWCLGVCLFVMLNYEYPFKVDEPKPQLYQKQLNRSYRFQKKIESKLSPNAKDMIRKLLEPNPKERISIINVCKHHWIPNNFHDLE